MPVADLHARCFSCSSSSKRRPWSAFFRGPKFGCRKVPNRQCREDVREQFTPLLQSPPLSAKRCAVALSCRRKTRIIFLFSGTLWIRWFYLFNLCTYRSELTSCTFLQEPYQISTSALSLVFLVAAVAGRLLRGLQTMARNSTQFHIETKKGGGGNTVVPTFIQKDKLRSDSSHSQGLYEEARYSKLYVNEGSGFQQQTVCRCTSKNFASQRESSLLRGNQVNLLIQAE